MRCNRVLVPESRCEARCTAARSRVALLCGCVAAWRADTAVLAYSRVQVGTAVFILACSAVGVSSAAVIDAIHSHSAHDVSCPPALLALLQRPAEGSEEAKTTR